MASHDKYEPSKLEKKWKKRWDEEGIHQPSLEEPSEPFYNLMMFPYPSAEGLHVGNMYAFTGADIYGRFKRMQGNDVFEPIGLDGFGIHSENYAIKVGKHPKEHARESEENFYRQLNQIGNAFAWENRLETYDPTYYRWTQWIFTKMFKEGLAYKGEATVNWCPSCKTVLADEQVESGVCERCGTQVERRKMNSWFFRITDFADRLLENIEKIDWPEKIKIAQRQWIGKKEGAKVSFKLNEDKLKEVEVFTTRLDTIFGATFLVIAPELAKEWIEKGWDAQNTVSEYIKDSLNKTEQQRKEEAGEKTGVDTKIKAVNPANDEEIPIFVADYVMMDVGTGAIMGVPGHDERDFSFAKSYDLEIKRVISETKKEKGGLKEAYEEDGYLVNSGDYNGLKSNEAREKLISGLKEAKKEVTYHLRDWLISRQRYWGPPIPMIFCEACEKKGEGERDDLPGWYSVPDKDLPVELPDIKDFEPKEGKTPLANAPDSWKKVKCPGCGEEAERELEISDTFLDSSWYFLAYPHMRNGEWIESGDEPFDKKLLKKWLPVDAYIGGAEHAVLHLLYARFVTMALHDMDYLTFEEPFPFLFTHGLLIKEGAKMSKSRGNVVIPDKYIEKFGADTLRSYLVFLGPYDQGGDFRDTGIEGMHRFLKRVWDLYKNYKDIVLVEEGDSREVLIKMHQTIKKVTKDIQEFKYNTSIAAIMEFVNLLRDLATSEGVKRVGEGYVRCAEWDDSLKVLCQLIAPFAPHMAEELWVDELGQRFSVHNSAWPEFNPDLTRELEVTVAVQVNGKLRNTLEMDREEALDEEKVVSEAKKQKNVKKWIEDKEIKDTIFVAGKIINFVTE